MIPNILHQTWKTELIPSEWMAFVESWRRHHPDWEFRLWTNADGAEFVRRVYPHFERTYVSYPHDIQRADAIRYLVVHHYGGFYADLDFECLQPLDALRDSKQLLIGFEPSKHADQQSRRELLCNALFGSECKSQFLTAVIDFLSNDDHPVDRRDVLATTGPLMLQRVYEQTKGRGVQTLPSTRFCPFVCNAPELAELAANTIVGEQIRKELIGADCYAVHHWANSWLDDSSIDPGFSEPSDVDGFTFYPRQDSPGNDLFCDARDITALAELCRNDDRVVAFNTFGFAKHEISSVYDFVAMSNAKQDDGLYVKRSDCDQLLVDGDCAKWQTVKLESVSPRPFFLRLDDTNDVIVGRHIRRTGVWEPIETELINRLISAGDSVIDVGAHIGYFTMIFSQLVGLEGHVYAFEPEQRNYSILQDNIRINGSANVSLENVAISNINGELSLHLSSYNSGDHRIANTANREIQQITCIALDQYFANRDAVVDFIKCDTQGHELEVLQGMVNIVEQNKARLACLFEYSPGLLQAAHPDGVHQLIRWFDCYSAEVYLIRSTLGGQEFVLMDHEALHDVATKLLAQKEIDACYNLLIFFSEHARNKYFSKLGW